MTSSEAADCSRSIAGLVSSTHPTRSPKCGLRRSLPRACRISGMHDARHTCGTTMHLQGVPPAVIAAWLGHADVAFTMRTYVHSQPDALAQGARS
jgi:integrase